MSLGEGFALSLMPR